VRVQLLVRGVLVAKEGVESAGSNEYEDDRKGGSARQGSGDVAKLKNRNYGLLREMPELLIVRRQALAPFAWASYFSPREGLFKI
jgi:hypothetical protein